MIPDTIADKAINADKRRNTAANKELNVAAAEAVDANKRQNAAAELSMLIKNQITRRTKLGGWIEVG